MSVQDETPKSRLTLTYKTEVNGEPQTVDLPMRLMVMGDFSQGTSEDRKYDLDERKVRSMDGKNTDQIMKDMNMSLDFVVENKVDPDNEENMRVHLPINSMKSFNPAEIAKEIPKLRTLLLFKELLKEVQSNVANKKEFSQLLNRLYSDKDAFEKMKEEMKSFAAYRLPEKKSMTAVETKTEE